jgi:hypothetical protein
LREAPGEEASNRIDGAPPPLSRTAACSRRSAFSGQLGPGHGATAGILPDAGVITVISAGANIGSAGAQNGPFVERQPLLSWVG